MGAQIGEKVPFWDSRDEFGDTCLLVLKPEEGRSLAKALGPNWLVLMRRHGATVAAKNLTELVFRTIYSLRNAELQLMCKIRANAQSAHAWRGEDGVGPQPDAAKHRRAPGNTGRCGLRRSANIRSARPKRRPRSGCAPQHPGKPPTAGRKKRR